MIGNPYNGLFRRSVFEAVRLLAGLADRFEPASGWPTFVDGPHAFHLNAAVAILHSRPVLIMEFGETTLMTMGFRQPAATVSWANDC